MLIHVLFTCIMLCISKLIWLEQQFTLEPMIILSLKENVEILWNKSNSWSKKRFLTAHWLHCQIFPWLQVKLFYPNTCSTIMVMGQLNLSKETNYVKWWTSSQPSILPISETPLLLINNVRMIEGMFLAFCLLRPIMFMTMLNIVVFQNNNWRGFFLQNVCWWKWEWILLGQADAT